MKRLACNLTSLDIPRKLLEEIPVLKPKAEALKAFRSLLTCNDHESEERKKKTDEAKEAAAAKQVEDEIEDPTDVPASASTTTPADQLEKETGALTDITPEDFTAAAEPVVTTDIVAIANVTDLLNKSSEDQDGNIMEKGQITILAMQNDTVDDTWSKMRDLADYFMKKMKRDHVLAVRVHAFYSEVQSTLALLRPDFVYEPEDAPHTVNQDIEVNDRVNSALFDNYAKQSRGSNFMYIRDPPVKQLSGSVAHYTLELAGIFDVSKELSSVFSQ